MYGPEDIVCLVKTKRRVLLSILCSVSDFRDFWFLDFSVIDNL